jgi:succinyl-CoA synthetase beta subunit
MNIHEFQAKIILKKYGIPIPPFFVVSNADELPPILEKMNLNEAVIKAQIHAGGRGKAGGIQIGRNRTEIIEGAKKLIGLKIVNNQTGTNGLAATQVMISPLISYEREYYLGCTINRETGETILLASPSGGINIEEIARSEPDRLLSLPFESGGRLHDYQLIRLVKFMGWTGAAAENGKRLARALCRAFCETDALLIEINPLVETQAGELLALDAKFTLDDNALWRQPEIKAFYDPAQLSPNDALATSQNISYIGLEGNIGCMVNGAGLAMATMDIIHFYGGHPANFLDVGGGATKEKVAQGFKIILSDPHVKAILINIFGGIMNCATISAGIISAATEQQFDIPLVIRLEGTNVEEGKKMLKDSGLSVILADNLEQAAQKVVASTLSNCANN